LARWRNHFCQLFNEHGARDVRHKEIHTTEPQVSELSAFEVEMVIEKLKRCKSPGIYHIPVEVIKAGCRTFRFEIHKLINLIQNKEEFPEEWKEISLYIFIRQVIKWIIVITEAYHFCQLHSKFYPTSYCQG